MQKSPKLEAQIAGLKGELETAQSKLGQLKADPGQSAGGDAADR